MAILMQRQPVLKTQDLVVCLKIAVSRNMHFSYAELARELSMSASEVHAASQRAEFAKLLRREEGSFKAVRSALQEFVIHGVKYAFPALFGSPTRGMATGLGAAPMRTFFAEGDMIPVWPDPEGEERGVALQPLYPTVPKAARVDQRLYEVLTLVDAIRAGAAREREIATTELMARLQ